MRNLFAFAFMIFFSMTAFSQDELDDIFDDGGKESQFKAGTSLLTFASGVPNIYVDYSPVEIFKVSVGIGIMPFENHNDYGLVSAYYMHDIPMNDTALTGGNYFTASLSLLSNYNSESIFNYYYYVQFRQRNYSMINDYFKAKTTKISFGMGYSIDLMGRLGLDIRIGMYLGRDKTYIDEDYDLPLSNSYNYRNVSFTNLQSERYERYPGFDFSIGLNYSL